MALRRRTATLLVAATLAGLGTALAPVAHAAGGPAPAYPVGSRTAPVGLVSSNPDDGVPVALDGQVQALAEVAGHVLVGGTFTQVRNARTSAALPRAGLFSYDEATGRVDPGFVPVLDGEVDALQASPDGATVYVAGTFKTVNGTQRAWLARIDAATGALVPGFNAVLNGRVQDLDLRGDRLYAIGWFSLAKGQARAGLAALDVDTGDPDPALTLPLATTRVQAGIRTVNVTPDRSRMVIAGNFTRVGTSARDQIAVIDLTTTPATVRADWATSALAYTCSTCTKPTIYTYVRDVAMSADGSYVVVGNTFYYPGNGDSALRFEVRRTGADLRPTWVHWTGTDTITAVTLTADGVAYLGGHFRWYAVGPSRTIYSGAGRVTRWGLAAVDAQTGMPYDWVPTRERGYGVLAMLVTASGDLVIGHDTTFVGGEQHPRLAMFPLAGGHQVAATPAPALPVEVTRVLPDGTENTLTWTGAAVAGSRTAAGPSVPRLQAGFVLGGSLVGVTPSGFFRFRPDQYGGWTASDRLVLFGVNPASVTAMAFQDETLYYTLAGDPNLYARGMNSDSLLTDLFPVVVAGPVIGAGRDYRTVRGLWAAGGWLWAGWADGHLDRSPLPAGSLPVTTSAAVTASGPALDGRDWSTPVYAGAPAAATGYRPDLALGRPATQSSTATAGEAARAVDGNLDGTQADGSVSSTLTGSSEWWQVDLGSVQQVDAIRLWPRTDFSGEWLSSPWVFVSDDPITGTTPQAIMATPGVTTLRVNGIPSPGTELAVGRTARYVRVQAPGLENAGVQLAEVQVLGAPAAAPAVRNGGFELAALAATAYQYRPPTVGWRFAGYSGLTTAGSGFTRNAPAMPEGRQAAFLQDGGSAAQQVQLSVGDVLTLSATQRVGSTTGPQTLGVYLDGVLQGSPLQPASGSWTRFSVPLEVSGDGPHTLELRGLTTAPGQERTAFVDAVAVVPATA